MNKKHLCSGHEVVAMSEEWLARIEKDQKLYTHGMVRLMPDGWLYPTTFTNFADKIYNFKLKSSDVVLMTTPKSGTTWMQEILWTMLHNPDLIHPDAHKNLLIRSPQIDFDMLQDGKAWVEKGVSMGDSFEELRQTCPDKKREDGVFVQLCEVTPDPRIIKTHLPLSLLPPDILDTAKVVYVARNPRDVTVSMYHHFQHLNLHSYTGTFENFAKSFMNNDLLYCPYWPHVKMAWEKKDHPNMHFVFYEDKKADIMSELRKLNDFLGANLTQQQLDNVVHHTSFSSMKSREREADDIVFNKDVQKSSGGFFRKGIIGDWRTHFSPELEQEMNHWIETNASEIGISFK